MHLYIEWNYFDFSKWNHWFCYFLFGNYQISYDTRIRLDYGAIEGGVRQAVMIDFDLIQGSFQMA
jgi:hypothetical protein